jgi:hypothetical protein
MTEHFFTPDTKEWLIIIGFLLTILVGPIVKGSVKKLIEDKEKRDDDRQATLTKSINDFKKDVLFMFDNHGHLIKCDNSACGKPVTIKTFIDIPHQRRDD